MKVKIWSVVLIALSLLGCGASTKSSETSPNVPPVPESYTVSGAISPPMAGVSVQLLNGTNIVKSEMADATNGSYLLSGIANGIYTIKPVLPVPATHTFEPAEYKSISINKNLTGLNFKAIAITQGLSISGRIDQQGIGLPGIMVNLAGSAVQSMKTLADGSYSFVGLASGGNYSVTPQLPSSPTSIQEFSPKSRPLMNLSSSSSNQNFIAVPTVTPGTPVTLNYTLYIKSGQLTINGGGGDTLDAWGYTDMVDGLPKFPGPQLNANEGDTVNVTVVNNHTIPHNLMIQGVSNALPAEIVAGASVTYSFIAVKAGSYLYYDTLNANINREMGLYGAMIVKPTNGSNTVSSVGGTITYDFQRIWILSEMDKPRWNDLAGAIPARTVVTTIYKPNYFLINGQSGFSGMTNPATFIEGTVGQKVLVRIINAGQFTNSLHFHSNHFKVLTVNGIQQASIKELDVIRVPPMSTAEVLYELNQIGDYPMHNHIAQMETSNGDYLNGIVTMIHIK